jgi:hypothetical protein
LKLEVTRDATTWHAWLEGLPFDPRDTLEYHRIALHLEEGEPHCALFEASSGTLLHPFLKRPIQSTSPLWDLATAYDLGGYLMRSDSPQDHRDLWTAFRAAWDEWCRDHRVVSEFVRLHPLRMPSLRAGLVDDAFEHHQDHAVVDLDTLPAEPERAYFPNHRRDVRRGLDNGLRCERLTAEGVTAFHDLYTRTMERVQAAAFYRFPLAYFRELVAEVPGCEILGVRVGGSLASAALFLRSEQTLYYFLSASDPEHWDLRTNNVLLDGAIRWAREEGLRQLHLGGGAPSLHRFKMGFGARSVPYYVLRRIHDPLTYERLIRTEDLSRGSFFPQYRASSFHGVR